VAGRWQGEDDLAWEYVKGMRNEDNDDDDDDLRVDTLSIIRKYVVHYSNF
jgi:hypothetical protein